jgi:hypothetical protein
LISSASSSRRESFLRKFESNSEAPCRFRNLVSVGDLMSDRTPGTAPKFAREFIGEGDKLLIRSACMLCGSSFSGNLTDGLLQWEQEHRCTLVAEDSEKPQAA